MSFDKIKYDNQYIADKYDSLRITTKKGNKQALRDFCNLNGLTINGLVNNLLAEYCKEHDIEFKR